MTPDAAAGLADLIERSIVGCTCASFVVLVQRGPDGDPVAGRIDHASATCPALLQLQLDYGVGGQLPDPDDDDEPRRNL